MLQGPVADVAPVEKQILHAVVAARDARIGDIAPHLDLLILMLDRDQCVGDFISKKCADPLRPSVRRR